MWIGDGGIERSRCKEAMARYCLGMVCRPVRLIGLRTKGFPNLSRPDRIQGCSRSFSAPEIRPSTDGFVSGRVRNDSQSDDPGNSLSIKLHI